MAFNRAKNFVINGNVYAVDNSRRGDSDTFIKLVNGACPGASYQSAERADHPRCHPDTRKKIIEEIMEWIDSPDMEKPIMWFHGSAGVGKSAIAQTIAERCSREGKLLSSFFFSRTATGTGRDDGQKLIPTIAYHLATAIPAAREIIDAELERDPAILQHSMEVQFRQLVIDPIKKIQGINSEPSVPYVVIIDGLDECNGPSLQARILTTISGSASLNVTGTKFFIASRPEREIQKTFDYFHVNSISMRLSLDADLSADDDIKTYLEDEFKRLKRTHPIATDLSRSHWPTDSDMWTLVNRSSGQFIYASTVIKYISDDDGDPREALQAIIHRSSMRHASEENPFAQLDALYVHILSEASSKAKGGYDAITSVMYILLLSNYRWLDCYESQWILFSIDNIAEFLDIDAAQVRLMITHLRSIVKVRSQLDEDYSSAFSLGKVRSQLDEVYGVLPFGNRIGLYHASMQDFLLDKSRSGAFFIDPIRGHGFMAQRCLNILLDIVDTEINEKGDVSSYMENASWDIPSPYWYDRYTPSSHIYALGSLIYHIVKGDVNIRLLRGYRQSVHHTITYILTTMLLKLPGYDMARSLQPPLVFDKELRYCITINENVPTAFSSCITSTLESLFFSTNHTDEMLLNCICAHVNYYDEMVHTARYPFQNLWAAATKENGNTLCLDKKKTQRLLQAVLDEYEASLQTTDYTKIRDPLKYYLEKFTTVDDFDLFTRSRTPDMKLLSEFIEGSNNLPNADDNLSVPEMAFQENDPIKSALSKYVRACLNNVVYDLMKETYFMHDKSDSSSDQRTSGVGSVLLIEETFCAHSDYNLETSCYCASCLHIERRTEAKCDAISDSDLRDIILNASSKISGGYEAILPILRCLVLSEKSNQNNIGSQIQILYTIGSLATFLEIETEILKVQLDHLSSLIYIPLHGTDNPFEEDQLIRFRYHSVNEFFLDKLRSGRFHIDFLEGHKLLAKHCLAVIRKPLTKDDVPTNESPSGDELHYPMQETSASQTYAFANYFFHMRCSNFDTELLEDFQKLSNYEVYSIISTMCKLSFKPRPTMSSFGDIFKFDIWSNNFSMPRNRKLIEICKRVGNAIDQYVKTRAKMPYANFIIRCSEAIMTHIDNLDTRCGFPNHFYCLEFWEGALMGSPERGDHLYVDEEKFRLAFCEEIRERSRTHLDWYFNGIVLTNLRYYFYRFKNASSIFTSLMKAQYPDIELSFESPEQVDSSLRKCIRVFLKDIVYEYLKHSDEELITTVNGEQHPEDNSDFNQLGLDAYNTSQTHLINSDDVSTSNEEEGKNLLRRIFCCI